MSAAFELFGVLGIGLVLCLLGLLSRRLGSATRAAPHYVLFFIAAALLFISAAARLINVVYRLIAIDQVPTSFAWVLLYAGLPALGITLGVIGAWHYWSWLLAERD
jgi:hypothetical protein